MKLRVVRILDGTSVDGPGLRTSIYLAGCDHRCPGCHNPSTWPFDAGEDMPCAELLQRIDDNEQDVTFSGGDPMYQAEALLPLLKELRSRHIGVWLYTGFTYEEILQAGGAMRHVLDYIDVLVDGPYIERLRDTTLLFRGSSNQRLIDVAASLHSNTLKEYTP